MKKLRICIVSFRSLPLYDEAYNRDNVMGGAEVNLYNLAVCFSQMKDIEVKVLVDDFGQPATYRKRNIELIRFGTVNDKKGLQGRISALRSCKQLVSLEADVFIFSCSHAFLGKLVFFQKWMKKKKVFYRLSSDMNMDLKNFKRENGSKNYLSYKFGFMNASAIIAQTEEQKAFLKAGLGVESHVIENGFFIRENISVRKKKEILWVGRCIGSKRPMLFVQLAKRLPEEEFVMIMPINKETSPEVGKRLQKLSKEVKRAAESLENLKLLDYVAYEDIQAYFDRAKIYVCTSELEGFPNTFIQACLGGTPILTYRIDPDNMIEKYGLGCCCNDNAEAAAAFIKGIDYTGLMEYKDRMLSYAAQKHNIYNSAEKYLELINKEDRKDFETSKEAIADG